jgi:TatD DNase family protein
MILKNFPCLNFHTHCPILSNEIVEIINYSLIACIKNTESTHSIGLHPWYIKDEKNALVQIFEINNYIEKNPPKLFAIGETGLDKLCDTPLALQKMVFEQHIRWSEHYKKPLIIHCVRAHQEILAFRKATRPTTPWVLHGFDKNVELAVQLYRHGFQFSLGAALLHPQKNWSSFFQYIPLTHIFLETDDRADITIEAMYEAAAKWANVEVEVLKKQVFENYLGWKI